MAGPETPVRVPAGPETAADAPKPAHASPPGCPSPPSPSPDDDPEAGAPPEDDADSPLPQSSDAGFRDPAPPRAASSHRTHPAPSHTPSALSGIGNWPVEDPAAFSKLNASSPPPRTPAHLLASSLPPPRTVRRADADAPLLAALRDLERGGKKRGRAEAVQAGERPGNGKRVRWEDLEGGTALRIGGQDWDESC
ncbi:hypothetical protein DFJ74DRAFT_764353 [Hyaloraphidium curvatum]|nr:hypothetical protein DFJ74DRAFT_764353 [Hyaloraphidium curvatum]